MSSASDGRWRPQVGDPTFMGWLTVLVYVAAAWLSLRAFRAERGRQAGSRRVARFWLLVGLLLLALGVNKQLDLQTLLIERLRDLAHRQGWYEERQRYQRAFVAALCAVSVVAGAWAWWTMRPFVAQVRVALLGLALLLVFVLLRAALFQHVGPRWLPVGASLHGWLELLGAFTVALAAWRAARRAPERPV